jgi:3-ketosteroid 9alpha-monooxygenase subunit B
MAWPRSTPLLDLLLAEGIAAPFSCREGACSACACRVSAGEVAMTRNDVLEKEDLDEGWVLGCQSLPVSDEVEVTYD